MIDKMKQQGEECMRALLLMGLILTSLGGCSGDASTVDSADTDTGIVENREALSDQGQYRVWIEPNPDPVPPLDVFSLQVRVEDATSSTPVEDLSALVVDATMPAHEHGMTVSPEAVDLGGGVWDASPFKFHMTGHWEITVDLTRGEDVERAVFNVICCEAPD